MIFNFWAGRPRVYVTAAGGRVLHPRKVISHFLFIWYFWTIVAGSIYHFEHFDVNFFHFCTSQEHCPPRHQAAEYRPDERVPQLWDQALRSRGSHQFVEIIMINLFAGQVSRVIQEGEEIKEIIGTPDYVGQCFTNIIIIIIIFKRLGKPLF